jgi:large subunit ribosomal protein L35Ae
MKGIVVQFRRGRHTIHERHFLLDIGMKNREEAKKMAGKEVVWKSPGKNPKEIKGKISDAHGNSGLVRAIFDKGLPGQAITTEIEIKDVNGKEENK